MSGQTAAGYVRAEQMDLFRVVEHIDSIFDALAVSPAPKTPGASDRF